MRRSKTEWDEIIAEYQRSEQSLEVYCREQGVSYSTMRYRLRKEREQEKPRVALFREVSVSEAPMYEVVLTNGRRIVVRGRSFLSLLEECER